MAEKTRIVGSDDKGQFNVPVPRSSIDRVDIIDLDMVLQTKDGSRLILPGAAIDAMSAKPPVVSFPDGRIGAADLLSSVGKVETPPSSIPAMTSLTQFDQKLTQGKKNRTDDADDKQAEQAQAQQVAPLPVGAGQSSVDDLMKKAEKLLDETRNKAFDPAPAQLHQTPAQTSDAPGSQPQTAKIPLYISLAEGNVVNVTPSAISETLTVGGVTRLYTTAISGSGGPSGSGVASGIQPTDALQYGTETLTGTAGNDVIYADGFAGLGAYRNTQATYANLNVETGQPNSAGTHFYYAKEIMLTLAGYIRTINSITLSGLPPGVVALVIDGNTYAITNGSISIPSSAVVPTTKSMTLIYDLSQVTNGIYDIKVNITGRAVDEINVTRTFKLQLEAVASEADITGNAPVYIPGSGWTDFYVLETASSPHLINAGAGDDLIYGGNSADTIYAGDGNDIVLAYAGNDTIDAGNGDNIIWAGNGNDRVITGTGNDTIHLGNGANRVDDSGGNNLIDSSADSGSDQVFITGNGNNTITLGVANDGIADGDDTVTTGTGIDTIKVGDGNNVVTTGDGNKSVVAGTGNDTVVTGAGDDFIDVGGADSSAGSANRNIVWAGDGKNTIIATSGNDTLIGGSGVDSISAGAGNDWIFGGAGNNNAANGGGLDGGAGNDWLSFNGIAKAAVSGGNATLADWLNYAGSSVSSVSFTADSTGSGTAAKGGGTTDDIANVENLIGTGGDDTLNMAAYTGVSHTLYGLDGNDVITGSDQADVLYGGAGMDSILGGAGNDVIFTAITSTGTGVDATALAGTNSDGASPSSGGLTYGVITNIMNIVDGGAGADTVIGGEGNDYFIAASGQSGDGTNIDVFYGAGGTDTIDFSSYTAQIILDPANNVARSGGLDIARFYNVEQWLTGSGNDVFTGTSASETVYGNGGDDTFTSNGGNDVFYGGASSNNTNAGDRFTASRNLGDTTTMDGGDGYNYYSLHQGTDIVIGGNDADQIAYGSSGSIIVNLSNSSQTAQLWNGTAFSGTSYTVAAASGKLNHAEGDSYRAIGDTSESKVEWVSGTGSSDVIYGNSLNNAVWTGTGNDAVWGFDGDDIVYVNNSGHKYLDGGTNSGLSVSAAAGIVTVSGGDSVDYNGLGYAQRVNLDGSAQTLKDASGADIATLAANTIISEVNATTTYTTQAYNFENYYGTSGIDIVAGTAGSNILDGRQGADTIFGMDGDDVILGGTGDTANTTTHSGSDYLDGGNGTDWISYATTAGADYNGRGIEVYLADADMDRNGSLDQIVAGSWAAGTGYSRFVVSSTLTLIDTLRNFENIIGSGNNDILAGDNGVNVIYGLNGNDNIFGAGGNDTLDGGAGNDTLDGGTGADVMIGGTGNDIYYVDNAGDSVTENFNEGTDLVYTSINYALTANVENLTALVNTGLTLTGNNLNNTITGGTGNDIIDGGTGNDVMIGGAGNDTYYVDSTSDVVSELAGNGIDTVYTTVNWTMSSNVEVLRASGGGNLSLGGSSGVDTIYGGTGNDTINGNAGADSMIGGAGDDTYYVDNVNDTITEASGEGMDTVYTTVSYTLSANVETLIANGNGAINLTGNSQDNTLTGGGGSNILRGGAGNDVLNGSGGTDSLYGDADSDSFVLSVAQLASTSVFGGSGNVYTNLTTENGTDTLVVAGWNLASNLSINRIHSIEAIDVRDGTANATSAISYDTINGILDAAATGGTLKLYLDSGDTFNATGSSTAGNYTDPGGGHTTTFTYTSGANSHNVEVHWG